GGEETRGSELASEEGKRRDQLRRGQGGRGRQRRSRDSLEATRGAGIGKWKGARKRNKIVIVGWLENQWDKEAAEKWLQSRLGLVRTWVIREKINRFEMKCKNWEDNKSIMRTKAGIRGSDIFIDHD
ncbi:hypothetical protein TSAR_004913, partial [Trichomalopsis sarcophagae]